MPHRGRLAFVLVLVLVAGCTSGEHASTTTSTPSTPTEGGPPLKFGGVVVDALDARAVANAEVRIDLSQKLPCQIEGFVWQNYVATTDPQGRFGPVEIPRPRSDDVAFFVHVGASGYSENRTFVGPVEARGDIGNLSIVVHPRASVDGTAPPLTVLALDDAPFPRLAVSDGANGTWSFEEARVVPTTLVAATDLPYRATVRAPETVAVPLPNASGWRLEGKLARENGAPIGADVIARDANGTLVSAARAGDNGFFGLPLPPTPGALTVVARTPEGHYGASKLLDVTGPPALRETLVMRALC